MWHKSSTYLGGATNDVAPLLINGVILRNNFQGIRCDSKLNAIIDTGASRTAIPIHIANEMKLPNAGSINLQSFDRKQNAKSYAKYNTQIFIPQWGWTIMWVIGCERDDILIGRDLCKNNLFMANWQTGGFGMRPAKTWHRPLELLFKRLRKKKM